MLPRGLTRLLGTIGKPFSNHAHEIGDLGRLLQEHNVKACLPQLAKSFTGMALSLPIPDAPTEIIYYDAASRMGNQQLMQAECVETLQQAKVLYCTADNLHINSSLFSELKRILSVDAPKRELVISMGSAMAATKFKSNWFEWLCEVKASLVASPEELAALWPTIADPLKPSTQGVETMADWIARQGLTLIIYSPQEIHWAASRIPVQSQYHLDLLSIQDPQGMMEAFTGAFLAGKLKEAPLEECVRLGLLLAVEAGKLPGYSLPKYLAIPNYLASKKQ